MPGSVTLTEEQGGSLWSADQLRFIDWLATPQQYRNPATQQALAAQNSVRPATLSTWKRLPGFAAQVRAAANALVADTWLVDIYHAMYTQALEGNVPAARFLFEAAGIMGERAEGGSVDRRVQFIILPPGSTELPQLAPAATVPVRDPDHRDSDAEPEG